MSSYGLMGLLKLVEASGGEVDTRIRIHKEAFLLALKGYRHFRDHTFKYHYYGPFSREVSDTVQSAILAGLLEENEAKFPDGTKRYTYNLTSKGRAFVANDQEMPGAMREFVEAMNQHHWRALELAATVAYLQQKERSLSQEKAFVMARSLKPETIPFTESARNILEGLKL